MVPLAITVERKQKGRGRETETERGINNHRVKIIDTYLSPK
jgi:hypothetical protein